MKRYLMRVGLFTVLALACALFVAHPAHGAQPALNRGTHAYAFGTILEDLTANTQTTDVFELYEIDGVGVQVDHGNIVGTLLFEGSNDGVTYYPVLWGGFSAISGVGGELQDVGNLRARYFRFTYTHTSGSGLIRITLHAKGR